MSTSTEPLAADTFRITPLSNAAVGPKRTLSAPLSAEITAALDASPAGEVAVKSVDVRIPLLEKNDILAERNRGYFLGRGLVALNLVSSPGAGKTTLLERTLDEFGQRTRCAVLVGDLETENDGRRLRRAHAPVALSRWASLSVARSPTMTPTRTWPARSAIVRQSSSVLPEPGAETTLSTRTP